MTIIDSHTHLMPRGFHYMSGMPLDEFVAMLDSAEIERAVIFTLEGLVRDFQRHNDELAGAIQRYPNRLVPLGSVNPWFGEDALDEVERCLTSLGFKGLKLHPWFTGFLANSPLMDGICEVAAKHGKPILFHTGTPPGSAPLQVGVLAERHPTNVFVLAHLGLPDLWPEAIAAAKRYPNLYLETAGAHSLSIRTAVEILGADRVLYGSDAPFGGSNNVFFQRDKVRLLGFSSVDMAKIMGDNARRVFGIASHDHA